MNCVVLIGNLRASLTLARELARAGCTVHCGVDEPDPYLFTSRHIRGWFEHPPVDQEPEAALRALDAYLALHPEIDVIVPVSDMAARLFSREQARFSGRAAVAVANRRAVSRCIDKAAMFDLCEALGAPVARRATVFDHPAMLEAVRAIGFPCVVKPLEAAEFIFGRKAVVLRSDADLAAVPHWPERHEALCVQRYVGGRRHDVFFAASRGRLIGAVDGEILRNDTADGTGYAVELRSVAPRPEVARTVRRLAAALEYDGVGAAQFMVDDAGGEVTFLELNPRLSACYRLTEACGLPLSRLMLEIALGGEPEPRTDPWCYPRGRHMVWIKGDIAGLKRELRRGALSPAAALGWSARLLRAAFRRRHLTFDPRDPAPTLWLYLHPVLRRLGLKPGERRRASLEATAAELAEAA